MNNLAKVKEEHKNRYLSYAEQQKHKGKVTGIFIIHPRLLLETTMMKKSLTETVLYHLPTWKPSMRKYFQNAADRFPTGINIVGFSQENFKRFISYLKYDN
jgi:hypothetical protein